MEMVQLICHSYCRVVVFGGPMSRMRSIARSLFLAVIAAVFLAPAIALAHPLGNFTVNRYSRIEVERGAIRVRYVLDVAEIAAVQEQQAADTDRDGSVSEAEWDAYKARKVEEIRRGLELNVDAAGIPLVTEGSSVSTPPGQANLLLVRVEARFRGEVAAGGAHRAAYRDRNEPTRQGWREILVRPGAGISIVRSTVPGEDISDELRTYPEDLLQSPLDRREAVWEFADGGAMSALPETLARDVVARPTDAFTALVSVADLSPTVVLLATLASAILGGIHAASPGHGKTVMAAYIVGSRGTFLHALALALSVTVSHTAGVLLLGAIALFASNVILPEQLYPWMTLASGLIVLIIGMGLVLRVLAARGGETMHGHAHADGDQHGQGHGHSHDSDHSHGHDERGHDHDHGHRHRHDLPITWRNLFALGLAGGIIPSASAVVVLLGALALGRLGFGLLLIVAFGVGMAVVLTATGVLLVYAGRLMAHYFPDTGSPLQGRFTRAIPLMSALVMTLIGAVVTVQALRQFGFLRV